MNGFVDDLILEFDPFELPAGLRYDGIMDCGAKQLFQFTELDLASPSYGASFYLDSRAALLAAVIARRAEKRAEFSAATK